MSDYYSDDDTDSGPYRGAIIGRYTKDDIVVVVKVPVIFQHSDEWFFNDDNFAASKPLFQQWERKHPDWSAYSMDEGALGHGGNYPSDGRIHVFKARLKAEDWLKEEEEMIELGMSNE